VSQSFGDRLRTAFDTKGQLCVGIDPHAFLLAEWGLTDDANGLREFGLRVVEAASDRVGIVKPQVSFFERHGSAGFAALERVLGEAREAGLLIIGDAKRGDIGSTFDGYAEAWLTPGSPLEVDALTVSPYLGVGSIEGPRSIALAAGKGLFVLSATSNPEASGLQTSVTASGISVAASIVDQVHEWNATEPGFGSVGLVLGATVALGAYGIAHDHLKNTPILAPGFGHQGAQFSELNGLFGSVAPNVVVSASRSILAAGPDGIAAAIDDQAALVAEAARA
jgi:orotidine-5'-phosphate decarboxylase